MAWATKIKNLKAGSSNLKQHSSTHPGVTGRTPVSTSITFTPFEFFGAAARCLHTHVINPTIVTPESLIISALVEQHVDDVNAPFAVLSSADRFKDYASSYFSGTVAAGLAYLQMIADGYVWCDHFENLASVSGRTPDFVFAQPGQSGVALVESKGTRSVPLVSTFHSTVGAGYTGQVDPHLGSTIGTAGIATHGFCIGAWLTSTSQGEMLIHYTAPAPSAGSGGGPPPATVQMHNYATAFRLAHSEQLSRDIRAGVIDRVVEFSTFNWNGLDFVSFPGLERRPIAPPHLNPWRIAAFAVERRTAAAVLTAALSRRTFEGGLQLPELSVETMIAARFDAGALFPDGFAVLSDASRFQPTRINWNPGTQSFVELRFG
jgi:hypothetical protein